MNIKYRKCPRCGGCLAYPDHPHAFGYKDTTRVVCRRRKTCGKRYKTHELEKWFEVQDAKESTK